MAGLTLALLGLPEVRHGGAIVAFPTRKVLAVLAYLAVEGGRHSREKLATLFWPESGDDSARATLRSTLARLRDALRETPDDRHIVATRETVAAAGLELDLHALEIASGRAQACVDAARLAPEARTALHAELQTAACVCRGEFLAEFGLSDAPEFDAWVAVQRETWRGRMGLVFDCLARLQAEEGAVAEALGTIERWLRLSPIEERAHRRLIELHLAAGDRAAALHAYERCRALLERELGVAPEAETEALARRIRAAGAPPRPARESARPEAAGAPSSPPLLPEAPLIGRTAEFVRLVELYRAACGGQPRVALIEGEAGIGKTRLAAEFLGWAAAQGADVLRGRAFETGGRLPYQPLLDAFRPRVEHENAPEDLLSDTWLAALVRVLPELRDRYPDLPEPGGEDAAARARLFEAMVRLGQALAERAPLVLFIDDVQWADAASLDVLHYAARRWVASATPVLLLLSLRSEELAELPSLEVWLLALKRDLACSRLRLGPFSPRDTAELLRAAGVALDGPGGAELARWLVAETGGHPFFVVETLKALLERGLLVPRPREAGGWVFDVGSPPAADAARRGFLAPGVREVIHTRLTRLTPAAQALLAAAAVLGRGFGFEHLRRVADVGEGDALPALDDLLRRHLLREAEADSYLFAHDKIRDVAYAEAGAARRRVFHRRALEALSGAAPAAELARHALAAGLDEAALRHSVAAGGDALRLLAGRDAAAHYRRAIELAERLGRRDLLPELRARRGRALASVALWAEAKAEFEAALERLEMDQHEQRAELFVALQEACFWLLDIPGTRRHAAEAITLARRLGRGDLETATIGWLAGADGGDGDLPTCLDQYERAVARARELRIPPPAHVQPLRAEALYWLGRYGDAVESGREAVRVARQAGDPWVIMYALSNLSMALAGCGRYGEALRACEEARSFGREYAVDTLLARTIAISSGLHRDLFDFERAETLAHEARELARRFDFLPSIASAGIDLLVSFARRREVGRTEGLLDEVAEAVERAAGFHGWLWRLRLAEARAEIALAREDLPEALRWADESIAQARARGRLKYQALGRLARARGLAGLGRGRDAVADFRAALGLARRIGDPVLFLHAASGLLPLDGDEALAAEARATIARIAAALPDPNLRRSFGAAEPVRAITRGATCQPCGAGSRAWSTGGTRA